MKNSQDIVNDLKTNLPLQASNEGGHSNLPGKDGGPYDAYRHIAWTAEMTRRYGENTARSMAAVHELEGDLKGQEPERRAMDEHNNEVGFTIGRTANSWDEVVKGAREAIDASLDHNGPATWLPEDQWRHADDNPDPAPLGPGKLPLPREQWNWPEPQWPEGPYPAHPLVPPPPPGNALRGLSFWDLEGWGSVHPYGINPVVNTAFNDARAVVQRQDPLAIDLDQDGIETIGITTTPVLFDHNGDGIRTPTGWLQGDDAWLVMDRNGNGTIDAGAELFGTDTLKSNGQFALSGFDALRDLDGDGNGLLNANDASFDQLQLWQDRNQDGLSQADELSSLADQGITAIDGFGLPAGINLGNGNRIAATALVYRRDGHPTQAVDLILADEPPLPLVPTPEPQIAQAPDMQTLPDPLPPDSEYAWEGNNAPALSPINHSLNDLWQLGFNAGRSAPLSQRPTMSASEAYFAARVESLVQAMAAFAPPRSAETSWQPHERSATLFPMLATPLS